MLGILIDAVSKKYSLEELEQRWNVKFPDYDALAADAVQTIKGSKPVLKKTTFEYDGNVVSKPTVSAEKADAYMSDKTMVFDNSCMGFFGKIKCFFARLIASLMEKIAALLKPFAVIYRYIMILLGFVLVPLQILGAMLVAMMGAVNGVRSLLSPWTYINLLLIITLYLFKLVLSLVFSLVLLILAPVIDMLAEKYMDREWFKRMYMGLYREVNQPGFLVVPWENVTDVAIHEKKGLLGKTEYLKIIEGEVFSYGFFSNIKHQLLALLLPAYWRQSALYVQLPKNSDERSAFIEAVNQRTGQLGS